MKWFLIILLAFSLLWIFFKDQAPESVQESGFASFMNSVLYPAEYQLHKNFPNLKKNYRHDILNNISSEKLINILSLIKKSQKQAFIFFYDEGGIVEKAVITGINNLIADKPELAKRFIAIAVGDDAEKFEIFVNTFNNIRFKKYLISESDFKQVENYFALKNDEKISKLPISFYKNKSTYQYDEISSGFFTKGRIEQLLESDI